MKVIINTINIYNNAFINHIQDNRININDDKFTANSDKMGEADLSDFVSHTVINKNEDHRLIAQLEERILQSERERKELLEKFSNENK